MKKYICGILGFPIGHSASPAMHNAAFAKLNLDGVYLRFEILPHLLRKAVESVRILGFTGVNVTIPYKEKVLPWLDELSEEARLIGAVNTIQNQDGKLVGHNTDALGFEQALKKRWGGSLKNSHIVLVGAGGAARAIAIQSGLSGARRLNIINRGQKRLKSLMRHLKTHFPRMEVAGFKWQDQKSRSEIQACDCVINATSLGMAANDPLPINPAWLQPKTFVYDLIYNPIKTRWVREASRRGCPSSGGLDMLLYQGALSFEIWTLRKPPIEVMRNALLKYLKVRT